ncbi:MAG: methionyl-tRNA formyltransferase [Porticoccaceae bacterium]|nr:methionyl-tRNA formyltransferase [Porticoccaceae bacterium]
MRVVFAGTPDFAAKHLQSVIDEGFDVVAVYTQPDRPSGRGKKINQSPVKKLSLDYNIDVFQPISLKNPEQHEILSKLNADVLIVVAYGLILPQAILEIPTYGCINVHGSELPRWRGAAPIQRAIEAGDKTTGVTIMQMDEGLDTGAMLTVSRCQIDPLETSGTLYEKLAALGCKTLIETLQQLTKGTLTAIPQNDQDCSYAHKIIKSEAEINWTESAAVIARRIRAFNPSPTCYSLINGQRLKIWQTFTDTDHPDRRGSTGEILSASSEGLLIQCGGQSCLVIKEIQLAGKSRLPVAEILKSKADLFACGKILGV